MPEVSFNTRKDRQGYGIDAFDVFWCRHGIIPPNDLARSEDEQIVSDLSISILNNEPLNASRETFDLYFDPSKEEFKTIQSSLKAYGHERLKNEFLTVIGAIRSVFETGEFLSFRNCVHKDPKNPARVSFFATFMAFHELIFKNGAFPDDFMGIRTALTDVQTKMKRSAHYATTPDREHNVSVVTGLIQKKFVKKDIASFGSANALVVELENSLRRARYEASRYEFKLGVCELSKRPALDAGMYSKIGRTACAIANGNPGFDGFIYIGVADKESAAERVRELFKIDPIKIGDVSFVGLEHDLKVLKINSEKYVRRLISEFSGLPISEPLKTQLSTCVDHAEYRGRPFVRVRIPPQRELMSYDGNYPIRKNSDTVEMTTKETLAQSKLFT